MRLYYDFHIHTALSPCGDNDMTPNNIAGMAMINELDCIAITDHNACGNVRAVMNAAQSLKAEYDYNLLVIPGMEVETSEEIHVVCLFPCLESALAFEQQIKAQLPAIKNKKEIFGEQLLLDEEDNVVGEEETMLITATTIALYDLIPLVKAAGGIAIPAHIDRSAYSILSNLGFIAEDLDVNLVEISAATDPDAYLLEKRKVLQKKCGVIRSSDAHYLENISGRNNYIFYDDELSAKNVIKRLLEM